MIKKICIIVLILLCSCKHKKSEEKLKDRDSAMSEYIKMGKARWIYNYWDNATDCFGDCPVPNINNFWKEIYKTDTIISIESYWKEILKEDSLIQEKKMFLKEFKADFINFQPLRNKTIIFLWTNKNYESLINQDYCKTISQPERAALSFIAMDALSDSKLDKTGKECTIESALDLDYLCSNKYKSYLELWFRNDSSSLSEIKNCYVQSNMSSAQIHFNKITLTIKGNKIYIDLKLEGFSRDIWESTWSGKIIFSVDKNNIKLIERKESEPNYVYFYPNGSDVRPPAGYKDNEKGEYRLVKKSKKK
ncbi:hypothetical protein [Flavobacterium sp. KJJ]|uniref:hypothetical protein n=1 Tax=Flavobacterium sp. KJJ TaxID=1270193 RepID=UPI000492EB9D|nr:hypothetical protein [Flavobacterium sp. KJJ]